MGKTQPRAGPMVRATAAAVARLLESGELAGPGQALPPERVLAGWLDVNRLTMRWAMERLVAAGRMVREQGRGAFAAASPRGVADRAEGDAVELIVDDVATAAGGWGWRVWLRVARLARERGVGARVVSVAEALNRKRGRGRVVGLGDRVDARALEEVGCCAVLGRAGAHVVTNVIDVDWSSAVDEAIAHVGVTDDDRVAVMFDARAAAVDAQRWCECVMTRVGARADVIGGGANEGAAYLAMRRHLREGGRPTVVFADEDLSAAGAVRAIGRAGLDVNRVRVVGRGGTRVSQYARITTLSPGVEAMAAMVMQRVMRGEVRREGMVMVGARCVVRG